MFPETCLRYTESTGYRAPMLRHAILPLTLVGLAHVIAVGQSSHTVAPGRASATFDALVQPFLAKNCYGCHNDKLSSGSTGKVEQLAEV